MKKEQIEQDANDRFPDNSFGYKGFIKGAQWRINSVWHDTKDEMPECNRHVVNEDWYDFIAKDEKDLKRILKKYPFKRWAYVEDLSPTEF